MLTEERFPARDITPTVKDMVVKGKLRCFGFVFCDRSLALISAFAFCQRRPALPLRTYYTKQIRSASTVLTMDRSFKKENKKSPHGLGGNQGSKTHVTRGGILRDEIRAEKGMLIAYLDSSSRIKDWLKMLKINIVLEPDYHWSVKESIDQWKHKPISSAFNISSLSPSTSLKCVATFVLIFH